MSKNQIIIALVVLCLLGTIWGSVQDKKATNLERQLTTMKAQPPAVVPAGDEDSVSDTSAVTEKALAEVEALTAQNQKLLANAATLKGSVDSQKEEIAGLKEELAESAGGSQALEVMQAQLDKLTAEVASLEQAVVAAKATIEEKDAALAAAEVTTAGLEQLKSTLANSVDEYSINNQALSAEVEECGARILSLEKALEERTKILVASGEELGRTKLNMNVLLSRIAAQNNSLEILEETRVALEKELAAKSQIIEDLQNQLSEQVIEEVPVAEEAVAVEETAFVEEVVPAEAVEAEKAVEGEEVPAH